MALAARLLLLVGLAVAPALAVVAYTEFETRQSRGSELRALAERTAIRASTEVRHLVDEVQRLSAVLAKLPEVRQAASEAEFSQSCSDLLVSLRHDYPGQLEFGVARKDGLIVCTTRGARGARPFDGAHLGRAVKANAFVVGGYGESQTTDARYLTFAHPVRDDTGHPVGAVLTGLDVRWIAERVSPFVGRFSSVLSVHDRDITFLARVPDEAGFIGRKPPPEVQALSRLANTGAMEATGADGRRRIGAIVSLTLSRDSPDRADLSVAFGLSRDAAFEEINAATRRTVGLILMSLALAAGAAWYGGRHFIRRPVELLLAAAGRWREGDYDARVALSDRSSELGRLAAAYEDMADALARREASQQLLINELNHRVKNTLATVQSIAMQSLRNSETPDKAHENFEARLLALASTHDLLTRENWEGASILEVIAQAIAPHSQTGPEGRFTIEGPTLRLPPSIILPFSMALHELCTNAAKYGALSNETGQVAIRWNVTGNTRCPRLCISWMERGGPPVAEPRRRGFGTRLIERSLAHQLQGEVQIHFHPEGVTCDIDIPLRTDWETERNDPAKPGLRT